MFIGQLIVMNVLAINISILGIGIARKNNNKIGIKKGIVN
jgi:hypothetical protein